MPRMIALDRVPLFDKGVWKNVLNASQVALLWSLNAFGKRSPSYINQVMVTNPITLLWIQDSAGIDQKIDGWFGILEL